MVASVPKSYIAVIGSGEANGALYKQASKIGRAIAERGGIAVCGSLGGTMEAAAKGSTQSGGVVLPDENQWRENEHLSYSVATGTGQARNLAVVCSADAVIAVGGGYGTLSEIGLARKVGRPVAALESWEFGDHAVSTSSRRRRPGQLACSIFGTEF